MPIDVKMPDGTVVRGVPEGITQTQLQAMLDKSAPHKSPYTAKPEGVAGWLGFLGRNAVEGLGQTADFIGNALSDNNPNSLFAPDEEDAQRQQDMEQGHPILAAATRMAGGAAIPVAGEAAQAQTAVQGLKTLARGLGGNAAVGAASHVANEVDPTGLLGTAVALNPINPVAAAKNFAKSKLAQYEAQAPQRVQSATADASAVNPGMQTYAQTTDSPILRKLGEGAAGSPTQEASARIADSLSAGLLKQAKDIAPLGVRSPEVASQVKDAIGKHDTELQQRADAVYTSGRGAVAKLGDGRVEVPNTVSAIDSLEAQVRDQTNLAPPEVSTRLLALRDSLKGAETGSSVMNAPQQPPGTTYTGLFDLRKQINSLYKDVPTDKITPAMDAAFAQLKSAYYKDLEALPPGKQKDLIVKTNKIYEGIQAKREELANSVVSQVLGKEGKNAISDPDAVLDRLVGQKPAAQAYTRDILTQYAPETLDALRSYAITKHVNDASRSSKAAFQSKTAADSLSPGTLADSGLFTPEQVAELNKRQNAVDTALSHLPETATGNTGVSPETAGRLLGSKLNPIFLTGAASKYLTGGKLERLLNTPEGRTALMDYKGKSVEVANAVKLWRAAIQQSMQPQAPQ